MLVAATHFFGLVAHEVVDDALVDAEGGEIAGKGMPQAMKANALELGARNEILEFAMNLVPVPGSELFITEDKLALLARSFMPFENSEEFRVDVYVPACKL